MSPEAWSTVAVGIVILIAIATSNRALRRELGERTAEVRQELGGRIDRLDGRVDGLGDRVAMLRLEMSERFGQVGERFGQVSERLGRIEGLLEGTGVTRRKPTEGRDLERGPDLPRRG